jgi:hypothetical protein
MGVLPVTMAGTGFTMYVRHGNAEDLHRRRKQRLPGAVLPRNVDAEHNKRLSSGLSGRRKWLWNATMRQRSRKIALEPSAGLGIS